MTSITPKTPFHKLSIICWQAMNIDCSHTPTSIDGHQDQVETTQCGKQEAEAKGAAIEI